jgi:hypothetical protein
MQQYAGKPWFPGCVMLFFFVTHLYRITDPPNGFHQWRETDTVAVAYNFYKESWNFFQPRIDMRGLGDGVVGMELPIYSYVTAMLFASVGYSHAWPRLLTVLGTCVFFLGLYRLLRRMTNSAAFAGLAIMLASVSPLLFFYGRKIQPDVWGLALGVNGLAFFVSWVLDNRHYHALLSAVCVSLAAAIKPTALCIGLPMLVLLFEQHRCAFLKKPRYWLYGMVCLLPVYAWFRYAWQINAATGINYFYLGGNWQEILQALQGWDFYQHAFLTWLWKLIIGIPLAWAFLYGLWKMQVSPQHRFFLSWLAGRYVVFALVARHIATSHDYYTLPAVPPVAFFTALGLSHALVHRQQMFRALAVLALAGMPVIAYGRVSHRYGKPYDFFEGRALANLYIPKEARVVTYDWTPCVLLYRTGRKGWRISHGSSLNEFLEAVRGGAQFFVVDHHRGYDLTPFQPYIGPPAYTHEIVTVYPLVPAVSAR